MTTSIIIVGGSIFFNGNTALILSYTQGRLSTWSDSSFRIIKVI